MKSLHDLSDLVAFGMSSSVSLPSVMVCHNLPLQEYPGQAEIERRKVEYIKSNPKFGSIATKLLSPVVILRVCGTWSRNSFLGILNLLPIPCKPMRYDLVLLM